MVDSIALLGIIGDSWQATRGVRKVHCAYSLVKSDLLQRSLWHIPTYLPPDPTPGLPFKSKGRPPLSFCFEAVTKQPARSSIVAEFPPSRRAQANLGKAPAWSLMQRVNRLPLYNPDTRPDGLINLSGALNNLMQDWWNEYFAKNPIDFDLSQSM